MLNLAMLENKLLNCKNTWLELQQSSLEIIEDIRNTQIE